MGIKLASKNELQWINRQYATIGFVPSNLERDKVAIVTYEDEYAGVGRIVRINENNLEIGGIYILPAFRGKNLAYELVNFLTEETKRFKEPNVYCIPFAELQHFYKKCGFKEINLQNENIDDVVHSKYKWCVNEYEKKVLLLKL
ncbi:GNAT family N-acetyltransferase [Priestia megaterium]|uniref:GNAT family N-acetyltransferase n=2 Tax=Priestia megaterium TaxID=1404 RepID=UPI0006ABA566|nr:GNAT family N-acetyltransferase [Priestia megaterium]KOP70791.1 acetyltransferase [Bacillus sp. FJAT-21351]